MVYQDIQAVHQDIKQSKLSNPVLLDRFFSFLIDYMVFAPFVSFFNYLIFKDTITYWRDNPDAPEQSALIAIIAVSVVTMFSLMQAGFIYFWKATPGQYFLKIQIQFAEGHLLFWRAFVRQFGFWSTPLFLGIPWIAMFSHPQRKTFYDRLADCRLVSFKFEEGFSFETESKYWQSLLATLIIFVGFLFATVMWMRYEKIVQRVASFEQLEQDKFFCEDLKNVSITSRLHVAVAMNVVGRLSDDCLDREADFVLWKDKKKDISLAYFAKSLTEKNSQNETTYLKQSCANEGEKAFKESSLGCQLAQTALSRDYDRMYAITEGRDSLLTDTYRYEIGLALDKKVDLVKNFKNLKKYSEQNLVKRYLLTEMINEKSSGGRTPATVNSIYDAELATQWVGDL